MRPDGDNPLWVSITLEVAIRYFHDAQWCLLNQQDANARKYALMAREYFSVIHRQNGTQGKDIQKVNKFLEHLKELEKK